MTETRRMRVLLQFLLITTSMVALHACKREERELQTAAPGATEESNVRTSALHAGPPTVEVRVANNYDTNAWAISEGQRLYDWMNCSGCHAPGGGGGIGPALTDNEWIYGSDPENIFDTILKGRPNGMPSFRGRLDNDDVWKLVAYVRTLGGFTRFDMPPARLERPSPADRNQRGMPDADTSKIRHESVTPPPSEFEP